MKQRAYIAHHIPGRIRIRIPYAKGDRALLEQIRQSIAPRPGVRNVKVNQTTGSVLIHFENFQLDEFNRGLADYAAHEDLFILDLNSHLEETNISHSIDSGFKNLSNGVKRATSGAIDLKELFPVALAAAALAVVKKAKGTPLWVSLLNFAFSSYMSLHEPEQIENVVIKEIKSLHEDIAALRAEIHLLSLQSRPT
jgi:Heavy metal associated domain 2